MPDNSSFGCMHSCPSKFELRLQLDSSSIAAINQAITGGMAEVARSVTAALEKMKGSLRDLAYWQRESLEKSNELHFVLTRTIQYELERLSKPPQQPQHPPPAELLQQHQQQEPDPPTAPILPTFPKPKGSKSLVPKQTAPAKTPKVQTSRPPLQKPMPRDAVSQPKTQEFHLHHVLVVSQQTCSLH